MNMGAVRIRYPLDVADGRLCTIQSDGAAVCQLLGMTRDLAPGDFPGLPQLYNPCDRVESRDHNELLTQLLQELQAFFNGLPRLHVRVEVERMDGGPFLGFIRLNGPNWGVRVPVRQGRFRVILDLESYEEV
jgi:hypothetical protein